MSSKDGPITQLPGRFKRPWKSTKKEEVKHLVPTTVSVHNKLAALRSKRVAVFFQAKARQRAGGQTLASVVGSSGRAVLTLLRSLRHLAVTFFSRKRQSLAALLGRESKWGRKLRLLPSVLTSEKSLLGMIQNTFRRTFRLDAGKKAQADRDRRQHKVRIYQWVCRALARLGRSAIVAARKRYRSESAALLSREMVNRLMIEQPPILAVKFVEMRERERLAKSARVIQRLWGRVKRNEQATVDAKARILGLLANMPSRLRQQQDTRQQTIKTVHDTSAIATRLFVQRAAHRLAARLIQRVWRGHCARQRARRLREWRMRKFLRRRQRERLRDARTALLTPSQVEQRYRKELETRMLARQQETPLLPVPRRDEHQRRRGERATLLEPLPLQSRPPLISSATRTKVQCVPFSRFEKIIAQDARVNLSNVWVAIPVGHQEQEEETGSRHGGLSPLLVGKGRKKRTRGGLQTTYDWVPANLLQSNGEREAREAAKTRQRQRATSPSVAKTILEF